MTDKRKVIIGVGINHRTAPVEERECMAFSEAEMDVSLAALRSKLGGGVILSTCNRTELYATADDDDQLGGRLIDHLISAKGIETPINRSHFYVVRNEQAVRHLYLVATGLDSMIIGEAQILGQVRDALAAAAQANSLNGVLSRLFHTSIAVGKRARRQTKIGCYGQSVSSTAVTLAKETFGRLGDRTVLVIGAGTGGKLAAMSLAEGGASRILVINRTHDRAEALAERLGGTAVPFQHLPEGLAKADIVISASGSDGFIIGPTQVAPAVADRKDRVLLLIDIAVPRNIDPTIRGIDGVRLFDIDDLGRIPSTGSNGHHTDVAEVQTIVEEEIERFLAWWNQLDTFHTIASLCQRADSIRRQELAKGLRRLPELSEQQQRRIEAMTAAMMKKMLHEPISRLKEKTDNRRRTEAVRDLFNIESDQ